MPWVRFDDVFPIHRKTARLSDAAFRLHVSAIFWSARNLTDGFLPEEDLGDVSARVRTPARFAAECVDRDLWHEADVPCNSPDCPPPVDKDGWRIHDYFDYQPSKAQVMRDREAAAVRQRRWRQRNAVSNGASNAVTNATPSRPVKDPPNPPQAGGHRGQHENCRACGTNPRGQPPPSDAARHPSARPIAEVLAVNHQPLRGDTVQERADAIRQAITPRKDSHD